MKIIKLAAENFKRLRAVEIAPNGNLVEIRGANAQGKSSVLDAIWCAVAGGKVLPQRPIRRGAETARIRLDLGEIIVTRKFGQGSSTVTVEAASGARFPSPQRMLDEMIGAIAFDPLEFTRMEPREQLDALRRLVKLDVDIDALDGQSARDYETRTEVNRDARRLRGQASGIQYSGDLPAEPIDIAALTERLRSAGEANSLLERLKARREGAAAAVDRDRRTAAERREEAADLRREADALESAAVEIEALAARIDNELAEQPALPDPVDTNDIVAQLEAARGINEQVEARLRRETIEAEARALEERSAALTAAMEERSARKTEAIADASMPVPGLSFGDGEVLFDGLPLDQASQAEKIRVSVAIAMAANPKLRVLCIRDGSLLDRESLRLLSEMIESQDYQCWLEVTDDDGKTGVVIEDGAIRSPEGSRPEQAATSAARELPL